jgi:alpha-galactosidase
VLLGVYQGQLAEGSNELRRLIRREYTPRLDGKEFIPAATYDIWELEDTFDEYLLRKLADAAVATGQEYFILDAGWNPGNSWWNSVGNWEQVNTSKLPNGLRPVADYVRSKGLKFGLWFEPERVVRGTQLAKAHPDWILWKRERMPSRDEEWPLEEQTDGLLDYGRPEVQRWVRELLDRYITDYDIRYIRYDLNIDPLPYWNANDEPTRRGVTQLRHVQGFYSVIDWIREHHPSTVLEGCAAGGRRIDLETARRFQTFWISDYTVDPSIVRFHLFGINHFLPGNYHYIEYTLPSPKQKDFQPDDLGFQSLFGGAFGTGGRVDLWPEGMKRRALVHVETWKKLRRYLVKDFYPLSGQPSDIKSWSGWQFQDPKDKSGFVQTFRTNTPEPTHHFVIHKLDERARYRFTDVYSNRTFDVDGATAMKQGIEVAQDPMSSRVFTYEEIAR